MNLFRVLMLLPLLAVAPGCNHHKFDNPAVHFQSPNKNENHVLNIQFNDHGDMWDERAYVDALALIGETKANSPTGHVIVVTYVHGWKHNAAPGDTDFTHFTALIRSIAEESDRLSPVIGVFIGWRGASIDVACTYSPCLQDVTFWSRHDAAKEVAGIRMSEVISQLMHATHQNDEQSRFIIIGHSFGGRVVETVLAQSMVSVLVDNTAEQPQGTRAPFDLAILLNTASEARQTFQFIESLHSIGLADNRLHPLILSITTQADRATGLLFPLGNVMPVLSSALVGDQQRDRDSTDGDSILNAHSNGQAYPGQYHQSMWTAGHMWFMRSHELVEDKAHPNELAIVPLAVGSDGKTAKPWNQTPYWVVYEPSGTIITGHSDIWDNPRLIRCLQAYVGSALKRDPARLEFRSPLKALTKSKTSINSGGEP